MARAKLTVAGLYNYDETLFDNLKVPEAINHDELCDNILLESGEMGTIYTDPDLLKAAIGIFSNTYAATFERWAKALAVEYDPLENYDRVEEWTDDTATTTQTMDSQTSSGTNQQTTEEEVVAYPSDALHDAGKTSVNGSDTASVTGTGSGAGTEKSAHKGRVHGNIGVTTSQQMLRSELDLGYWNIIKRITALFIQHFCIMIY